MINNTIKSKVEGKIKQKIKQKNLESSNNEEEIEKKNTFLNNITKNVTKSLVSDRIKKRSPARVASLSIEQKVENKVIKGLFQHKFKEKVKVKVKEEDNQDNYDEQAEEEEEQVDELAPKMTIPNSFLFLGHTMYEIFEKIEFTDINYLDLYKLYIPKQHNHIISKMTNLKYLGLANSNIGNDLYEILNIVSSIRTIKVLDLAENNISSISFDETLYFGIKALQLQSNEISLLSSVSSFIGRCVSIVFLTLNENPISFETKYRINIAQTFPKLKLLDDQQISDEERQPFLDLVESKFSTGTHFMLNKDGLNIRKTRQYKINNMGLIGLNQTAYNDIKYLGNFITSLKPNKTTIISDEHLYQYFEKSIEISTENGVKHSPITKIQLMFISKISYKNFTNMRQSTLNAVLKIQKHQQKQRVKKVLQNNFDYQQTQQNRIEEINVHFRQWKWLRILKKLQKKYKFKYQMQKIIKKKITLAKKVEAVYLSNSVKIKQTRDLQGLNPGKKVQFLKNQILLIKKILDKFTKGDQKLHNCRDFMTIIKPEPDYMRQNEFNLINLQKYIYEDKLLVKKSKKSDLFRKSARNFEQILNLNDGVEQKRNLQTLNKLYKVPKVDPKIRKNYEFINEHKMSQVGPNYQDFMYWIPKDEFEIKCFINRVQFFNKLNQHDLVIKTFDRYQNIKERLEKNSRLQYDEIEYDPEVDEQLLECLKSPLYPNRKEEKFKRQIKEQYHGLMDRKIIGEHFDSFLNAYPAQTVANYRQLIQWSEDSVRRLAAVTTIQSCWRRIIAKKNISYNVLLPLTQQQASRMIRKNILRQRWTRRFHLLHDLKGLLNFCHSRVEMTKPSKKRRDGWQDLLIDEHTLVHLLRMTKEDISKRTKVPEQKFMVNFINPNNTLGITYKQLLLPQMNNQLARGEFQLNLFPEWIDDGFENVLQCMIAEEVDMKAMNEQANKDRRKMENNINKDEQEVQIHDKSKDPLIKRLFLNKGSYVSPEKKIKRYEEKEYSYSPRINKKKDGRRSSTKHNDERRYSEQFQEEDNRPDLLEIMSKVKKENNNNEPNEEDSDKLTLFYRHTDDVTKDAIIHRIKDTVYGQNTYLDIENKNTCRFNKLIFNHNEVEIFRTKNMIDCKSEYERTVRIKCNNLVDALTLTVMTFLWTYDRGNQALMLPEAMLMSNDFNYKDINYISYLRDNNMKQTNVTEQPIFNDVINRGIQEYTMNQNSISLTHQNTEKFLINFDQSSKIDLMSKKELDKLNHLKMINDSNRQEAEFVKAQIQHNQEQEYINNKMLVDKVKYKSFKNPQNVDNIQNVDEMMQNKHQKMLMDELERNQVKERIKINETTDYKAKREVIMAVKENLKNNVSMAMEQKNNELSKSIRIERNKRKDNLDKLQMREIENAHKVLDVKDNQNVNKQISMQKKRNQENSQWVARKFNRLQNISKREEHRELESISIQQNAERLLDLNYNFNKRSLDLQRWASTERQRKKDEYDRSKWQFEIQQKDLKEKQKNELEDLKEVIKKSRDEDHGMSNLARQYNASPFRHKYKASVSMDESLLLPNYSMTPKPNSKRNRVQSKVVDSSHELNASTQQESKNLKMEDSILTTNLNKSQDSYANIRSKRGFAMTDSAATIDVEGKSPNSNKNIKFENETFQNENKKTK